MCFVEKIYNVEEIFLLLYKYIQKRYFPKNFVIETSIGKYLLYSKQHR